ncbi:hypothetical protein CJ030_MR2G008601 [Morella rubra]|uniref:Retrotransposon gag domain-containing protein n=1 Tax=Morella rubra TaxID=262757 RepID=A0A6A1WDJ2_9ROSI|nr:hypothetical protein CJ030_MR2G008601 [Morella rubra]
MPGRLREEPRQAGTAYSTEASAYYYKIITRYKKQHRSKQWWWRIEAQYKKERRLGWIAFKREFLLYFGSSPMVTYHDQRTKLKQEGKVQAYVEEAYKSKISLVEDRLPSKGIKLMQAMASEKAQGEEAINEHSKSEAKEFLLVGEEPNNDSTKEVDEQEPMEVKSGNEEEVEIRQEDKLSTNMINGLGESSFEEKGDHFAKRKIEEEQQSTNIVNELEKSSLVQCKAEVSNIELVGEGSGPLDMEINSGDQRKCLWLAHGVSMEIQEVNIEAHLHVPDMVDLEVILDNAWLRSIDKVLIDYETMAMKFLIHGGENKWTTLASVEASELVDTGWKIGEVKTRSKVEELPMVRTMCDEVADDFESFKLSIWARKVGINFKELEVKHKILEATNIREIEWKKQGQAKKTYGMDLKGNINLGKRKIDRG